MTFRSLTARTCSVRGTQVTGLEAGACTILASVRSNPLYKAASKKRTFRVRPPRP